MSTATATKGRPLNLLRQKTTDQPDLLCPYIVVADFLTPTTKDPHRPNLEEEEEEEEARPQPLKKTARHICTNI